jgi:hypothetical protein
MNFASYGKTSPAAIRAAKIEADALLMRQQGYNYENIADALNLTIAQVSTAVRRGLKRYREEAKESARNIVELEVSRLDYLLAEALRHVRSGDLDGITVALKVQERRAKLLGLDGAFKVEPKKPEPVNLGALPADDLTTLAEIFERAGLGEDADEDAGISLADDDAARDYGLDLNEGK